MACKVCGCSDFDACVDEDGQPCYWVDDDLCSACWKRVAMRLAA